MSNQIQSQTKPAQQQGSTTPRPQAGTEDRPSQMGAPTQFTDWASI